MAEIHVNEELLSCIKKMQIQSLKYERIPFPTVLEMDDKTQVHMILICEENPKFKLKKRHYANLSVGEAKIYIQLGIQEEENEC